MSGCEGKWGRFVALGLMALTLGAMSCKDSQDPGTCQQEARSAPAVCEPLDRSKPSPSSGGLCAGEWCWASPVPQGQHLYGVWSPTHGVAWMVGARGTVLRVEGARVELKSAFTRADLLKVWGSSETDIWAAGIQGTLLHWNGSTWTETPRMTAGDIRVLWGTSSTNVWAGGDGGFLMRWDGAAWSPVALGTASTVTDLWAANAGDLWVATGDGVRRCGAGGCVPVEGPGGAGVKFAPTRVQGLSEQVVYFLESRPPGTQLPRVFRWDVGSWAKVAELPAPQEAYDFAVAAPDVIRVSVRGMSYVGPRLIPVFGVLRWTGSSWETDRLDYRGPSYEIWGAGRWDAWAVGWAGGILRGEAEGWRSLTAEHALLRPSGSAFPLDQRMQIPIGDLLGLPGGGVATILGTSRFWEVEPGDTWTARVVTALPPLPSQFETELRVERDSQNGVEVLLSAEEDEGSPVGIHGSSTSNVWVASSRGLHRFDGTAWTQPVVTSGLTGALWVFGPDDVWAGTLGGLLHWSCGNFTLIPMEGLSVTGLWGASQDDLWAVGTRNGSGEAWHWDGKAWTQFPLPSPSEAVGVIDLVGRCSDELYAVGSARAVYRWDGKQWRAIALPFHLGSLTGAARVGAELWVAGESVAPYVKEDFMATPPSRRNILRHPW